MTTSAGWLGVAVLCGMAACSGADIDPMQVQPRYLPYSENPFFSNRRAMRPLVGGTISREQPVGDSAFVTGKVNGHYVTELPVPVTVGLLRLGQKRYGISCAPCHGLLGDGNSVVAHKMSLRPAPSLLLHTLARGAAAGGVAPEEPPSTSPNALPQALAARHDHGSGRRSHAPGFFFEVITSGFGLMSAYSDTIPVAERWAVIAYLGALQLSQGASVAALPPDDRAMLPRIRP